MKNFSMPYYLPTGNEYVSIPTLYSGNGAIESVNFLSMSSRGLIGITGSKDKPLIKPYLRVNGQETQIKDLSWEREDYWIPKFMLNLPKVRLTGKICAPVGERGFLYTLEVCNLSETELEINLGLQGTWAQAIHSINESKAIRGEKIAYYSFWNHGLAFDFRTAMTVFSFGAIPSESVTSFCKFEGEAVSITQTTRESLIFPDGKELSYRMGKQLQLNPKENREITFFWGIGLEEVGALTSAKEMYRHGAERMLERTSQWLRQRKLELTESELEEVLNLNAFFNVFFASGKTLDTEELVLVTSRSPRYYVSAAYWDRDSLLWSFPSIMHLDREYAREMLDYVFTRQIRNVGVHSRYIDGTLLEPGFELDELCAPVIALHYYVELTQDFDYLKEDRINQGLNRILSRLQLHQHPSIHLYETFLLPSDDVTPHAYVTYDNVLVWKAFRCYAAFAEWAGHSGQADYFLSEAKEVKDAIWQDCLMEHDGNSIFSWSTDLQGNFRFYDEPPGSLQLLAYYGFCQETDPVYVNTVKAIRSPLNRHAFANCNFSELGCEHAEHPWVLSICNSLLSGRDQEAKDLLLRLELDGGIACESFDEHEGFCQTGQAFATCAGFLAFSIYKAFGKKEKVR